MKTVKISVKAINFSDLLNALPKKAQEEVGQSIDNAFTWGDTSLVMVDVPRFCEAADNKHVDSLLAENQKDYIILNG